MRQVGGDFFFLRVNLHFEIDFTLEQGQNKHEKLRNLKAKYLVLS